MIATPLRLVRLALGAAALTGALHLGSGQEAREPAGPEVGKPAPTFRLNDHQGKAVAFGGSSETWRVLAFYPKASTPG